MIGKLTGRLDYRAADHVLIDVRGVGYIVYCSDRTLAALPGVGEAVSIYTDMVVREDLMQLYGFLSLVEKEWHRLLCSVQGVGAKVSLAILSALGPDGVSRAIALGDWASVKAAKGRGAQDGAADCAGPQRQGAGRDGDGWHGDRGDGRPAIEVVELAEPVPAPRRAVKAALGVGCGLGGCAVGAWAIWAMARPRRRQPWPRRRPACLMRVRPT